MPKLINMPKLSDTMTEGTLVKWHVKEGDTIDLGKIIADVETDKATMEMEAFDGGKIHKILIKEGSKVPLGAAMVVLLAEGEEPPADLDAYIAANSAAPAKKEDSASAGADKGKTSEPAASRKAFSGVLPPTGPRSKGRGSRSTTGKNGVRVKASPLARKIADAGGIDLTTIIGTGPGGRILAADVENAATSGSGSTSAAPARPQQTIRPVVGPEDTRIPLTGMRTIIAERLTASKTQIPHFYLNIDVDAAPLMSFRKHINESSEKLNGNKYSVNDFVLRAVVRAAAAVPAINASWDEDAIVQFKNVNLSVAIAVPDGLVTPVIRAAETKSLLEISQAVKDLASRAKNKKLSPDEFTGGTITVSNLGAYGIDSFSAIINPPQAAIISVGSIRKVPVVDEKGNVIAGQRMSIGISADHRVVDGAVAANFLAEVRKLLENPALMLM